VADVERQAAVTWEGDVRQGHGLVTAATSEAFRDLEVSLPTRAGAANGHTSPEELLGASHAGCYAMALSATLTGKGTPPERLDVSASVGLGQKAGGGYEVTHSNLTVRGRVPGIDQAAFEAAAREAEQSCPISNAIRNNVQIGLDATLDDA